MNLSSPQILHERTLRVSRFCRMAAAALFVFAMLFIPGGCHNSDLWSELPEDISHFISQYYPNSEVQSYTRNAGIYHVRLDDGPGLTFDSSYQWTDIDGYGMPLPQVLLFDQLPPKIYQYLQETDQLNAVFAVSRDSTEYALTLLDQNLRYDIASGELTGTAPTSETPARQPQ